ncbi:hypothetical protein Cfor_00901 [Coptotermes formosanus]|uniref:Uncharacterized protein n=1 Tax=Coptotermes formosanus TaxID=36987 RepID=A0A6L2PJE8_COPFO|nr:hypothetical protein Cfor_00901 [Coptotermes formosanus]
MEDSEVSEAKEARQVRSKVKEGVVHREYAPEGQTVNKEYYVEVLRRLRDAVWRKRPAMWKQGENVEEEDVSRHEGDEKKCDDGAVGYSKESFP